MNSQHQGVRADITTVGAGQAELSASALIQQWQGFITETIRRLLRSRRARRLCDEDDLRQCVSLAILVAARRGQLRADCPQQLAALIARIAANQVNAAMRAAFASCRDCRRTQQLDCSSARKVPDPESDPTESVESEELQQAVLEQLDDTAKRIVFKLKLGLTWAEIAAEEPDRPTAESVRKMFTRNLRPRIGRFFRAEAG